ncbi:hypothetical protein KSX_51050 [Ktedonospora formicarum]|uniref:Uncharacterized protein n=1 Tax=Ktedonospora formicarum TaxID=2778364 RepID=A0A8J3I6G4_9CHLR|nr:hypothetical protein KSX_51050 [Ktedonospora formicarum]
MQPYKSSVGQRRLSEHSWEDGLESRSAYALPYFSWLVVSFLGNSGSGVRPSVSCRTLPQEKEHKDWR